MAEGDIYRALQVLTGTSEEDIKDLLAVAEKINNPMVLGILVAALIEERKKTNRLLEEILKRLSRKEEEKEIVGLSDQDERILELVREKEMVTAEDVREALGYRGLNGASARLNRLYRMGILKKIRKGKKVYFMLA